MDPEKLFDSLNNEASLKELNTFLQSHTLHVRKKKYISDALRNIILTQKNQNDEIAIEAIHCLGSDALWGTNNALWLEAQREQLIAGKRIRLVEAIDELFGSKVAKGKIRYFVRRIKSN